MSGSREDEAAMKPEAIEAAKRIVSAIDGIGERFKLDDAETVARALLASEPTQTDREMAANILSTAPCLEHGLVHCFSCQKEAIAAALASARTAARAEALEEAARHHDEQAAKYDELAVALAKFHDEDHAAITAAKEDAAAHRHYGSAIRALKGAA